MATRNNVTGDPIKSRVTTQDYKDGWDRIFGDNKQKDEQT